MEQDSFLSGRDYLVALSHRYEGKWDPIYNDIRNRATEDVSAYFPTEEELKGWTPVTILDEDKYPRKLRSAVAKPPFVIYAKGDLGHLAATEDALLIISPRAYSHYSAASAMVMAARDKKIPAVILWNDPDAEMAGNGYALEALRAYQWSKVPFIVVIPPLCRDPEAIANEVAATGGLAIMEAFPGSERRSDPMACRIGTGLAKAALVLGGTALPNAASWAALLALNAGLDVGALAWPALSSNGKLCHDLIRDGALCVSDPEDLLTLLGKGDDENA